MGAGVDVGVGGVVLINKGVGYYYDYDINIRNEKVKR